MKPDFPCPRWTDSWLATEVFGRQISRYILRRDPGLGLEYFDWHGTARWRHAVCARNLKRLSQVSLRQGLAESHETTLQIAHLHPVKRHSGRWRYCPDASYVRVRRELPQGTDAHSRAVPGGRSGSAELDLQHSCKGPERQRSL